MNYLNKYLARTERVGGCMEWRGCLNSDGYPRVNYKGNANGKLHRIIYSLCHPDDSIDGKVIRHRCDNPRCINPEHLETGSHADNMRDRDVRQRHGTAAFTPMEVKAIRALYLTGEYKQVELAKLFNVDHRTINYLVHGRTYRWVR